jgi:hypothetical protein
LVVTEGAGSEPGSCSAAPNPLLAERKLTNSKNVTAQVGFQFSFRVIFNYLLYFNQDPEWAGFIYKVDSIIERRWRMALVH